MRQFTIGINNGIVADKIEGSINFHRAPNQESAENNPIPEFHKQQRSDSLAVKILQEMYETYEARRLLQLDFPEFAKLLPSGNIDSGSFFGELILSARRYSVLSEVISILERERTAQSERFCALRKALGNQ